MKVCCYDCGKTDVKLFERPRTMKSGLKNTVDVCRKCQIAWYKNINCFSLDITSNALVVDMSRVQHHQFL